MNKFLLNICFVITLNYPINTYLLLAQNKCDFSQKTFHFQDILSEDGIDLGASFVGDYFFNLSGGIQNEGTHLANIILYSGFDMDKIAGITGMSFYLSTIGINGGIPFENTGALQGVSNIAGANQWKLYEAWIQQSFFNENFSLLFGLYDLNSEFDVRESSGIFINPSFGIGFDFAQSGQNGPSIFPYTSLAFRLEVGVSESFNLIASVFDGVPGSPADDKSFNIYWNNDDGVLLSIELIFSPGEKKFGKGYSKFSIGSWYYTSDFENISNGMNETGNYGIYVNGEKFIYSENSSTEQGLALFGRFGIANSNFNPSDYSILGGVNYTGLIHGRDEDIFGLAFSSIHLADEFRIAEEFDANFETILELTYSFQVFNWLMLQPDLQYILNPSAAPHSDYAFITGLRAELVF